MLRRPLPGPNSRNEPTVLSHVLGDVIGIEDDGRIEIREKDDASTVEQVIQRHPIVQLIRERLAPAAGREHARNRRRERQNRRGEDDRNDAAGVHLQWNVRVRAAVHAAPDHALGILHDHPSMAPLDEDDRPHHGDHQREQSDQAKQSDLTRAQLIDGRDHCARQPHDDAGEDDQRHAVADTSLRDLFTEPHDEDRTGRQGQDRQQAERPARLVHQGESAGDIRLPLEENGNAQRLHDAQKQRAVPRVLRDLAPAELALFLQPLEVGPHDRQQLQDDRRADVGHDAQREDRHPRQIPAGKHIVEPEHRIPGLLREDRERFRIHAWRRYVVAHAVDAQHRKREQHAVPQLRDGEDALEAFDHGSVSSQPSTTMAWPPLAAIFSAALPLNRWACTVSAFVTSPRASTLTRRLAP